MRERRSLHQPEVVVLADALRRVCQPTPDGLAVYTGNHTDESLAQLLRAKIPQINARHVARLRQRLIGTLKDEASLQVTRGNTLAIQELKDRLDALEVTRAPGHPGHYISELGTRVTRLEAAFKRLAEAWGEPIE